MAIEHGTYIILCWLDQVELILNFKMESINEDSK